MRKVTIAIIPFIALHKFESYLFVDFKIIQKIFPETNALSKLKAIKSAFDSAEGRIRRNIIWLSRKSKGEKHNRPDGIIQ